MTRFFVTLATVSLLLVLASWTLVRLELIHILPSFFFQTLILLLFGTCLLYVYLFRLKAAFFVQVYLLTMAVKLLAYGVYNYFVITEDESGAVSNVVWFMLLYLIFTVLEVGFLYQKISK